MAERVLSLWASVGEPANLDAPRECPDCGFDSVLDFPVTLLSGRGVTGDRTIAACPRCFKED